MNLELHGRVAMVAAASKGIGLAIAKTLAEEGARVSIASRSEEHLVDARSRVPSLAHHFVASVDREHALHAWHQDVVKTLGVPTVLVTNTGGPKPGRAHALSDQDWMEGFESTLLPVVRLVRLVTPGMQKENWGRILHVTSSSAWEPMPNLAISSTLRRGLSALTKLQAQELGPYGITVNALLPGNTRTERQMELAEVRAHEKGITTDAYFEQVAAASALRRLAEPEEMGRVGAFLCSAAASFITGTSVLVDGGITHH